MVPGPAVVVFGLIIAVEVLADAADVVILLLSGGALDAVDGWAGSGCLLVAALGWEGVASVGGGVSSTSMASGPGPVGGAGPGAEGPAKAAADGAAAEGGWISCVCRRMAVRLMAAASTAFAVASTCTEVSILTWV